MAPADGPLAVLGAGARLAGLDPAEAVRRAVTGTPATTVGVHERWAEWGPFRHAQPSAATVAAGVREPGRPLPPLQVLLALDACDQAVDGAGDALHRHPAERVAVVVTSEFGPASVGAELAHGLVTRGRRAVGPVQFASSVHNGAAGALARRRGWRGPTLTVTGAGWDTARTLLAGDAADVVVLVAVDEVGSAVPVLAADGLLDTGAGAGPRTVAPAAGAAALVLARGDEDGGAGDGADDGTAGGVDDGTAGGADGGTDDGTVRGAADGAAGGAALRLDVVRGRRVPASDGSGPAPAALAALLARADVGGDARDVWLLASSTAAGAADEDAALRAAAGAPVRTLAPWRWLGEPYAVRGAGAVVLACALHAGGLATGADAGAGRGAAPRRAHCLVRDRAGHLDLVTVRRG